MSDNSDMEHQEPPSEFQPDGIQDQTGQEEIELTPEQMEQLQQQMEEQGMLDDQDSGQYDQSGMGQEYIQQRADSDDGEFDDEEQLRKVRRDLLENINRERIEHKMEPLYLELLSNIIANQYAEYLIDSDHNDQFFSDTLIKQHNFRGEYNLCYIQSYYEQDVEVTQLYNYDYFMELGYLFLESTEEKQHLMNPEINHVGMGVAMDRDKVVIVLMLSTKVLCVQRIQPSDNGGIEVRGRLLRSQDKDKDKNQIGLFACKVVSSEDPNKEIGRGSGPDKIQYNRNTKEFIVQLDNHELDQGNRYSKYLEFYTRINIDAIPYGKKNRDSEKAINYRHIDFQLRVPCFIYPDPRFAEEDEAERIRRENELKEKQEQERLLQEQQEKERMEQALIENEGDDDEEDEDGSDEEDSKEDEEDQYQKQEQKEPVISNKEIREDLERAINEAQQQHKEFKDQNIILQQRIKALRSRNELYVERQNEMAMNDHKYLNTLAHVHQIRLDLQQTQKNYNAMAQELQQKLETKQRKCNEIKLAFMELKREVAKKAANSRNDKPIPEKQIEEWEEKEIEKDKALQELRLDNLRLRNTLIKNQKILKKKEELAEGLHLIDFEQLKIENQTLNEKIEERHEDLHKLKKKNTTTVQILTHTREKLKFIQQKNEALKKENQYQEKLQNEKRNELSKAKETKDKNQQVVLQYQQITGISRSSALKEDFKRLQERVFKLKDEREALKNSLKQMQDTIIDYENIKLKQMQNQQEGIPQMY